MSSSNSKKRSDFFKNEYVKTILLAVIVLGGVAGFWFGMRFAFRTDYPFLTVASNSMVPVLYRGDLILVQGIKASDVYAASKPQGDIIVFFEPNNPDERIVHRAVYKELHNGLWYIRSEGDANGAPDPWYGPDTWNGMFSERLLIGKVVAKVPWLGFIPLYLNPRYNPLGIFLIIALILVIIFAEYLPIWSKKEKPEEKPAQS